jgi:arabinofuranan 3-O-arabinosyltransferase
VSPEDDAPRTGLATSRLRMFGYAAILTAMAFSQSAGRMVADTKFDLLTNPVKFLSNGLRLWDPSAAFGQVQNQAYGYAWPMGPFFLLGDLVHLPPWVTQRLWWALLLCLAFFGVVRLAQKLALGSPLTQVLAGFAFVLTPRITTLLGGTSVEIWPMALAPWVLIPLVVGSERGSVRRAAAWSALAVACCGGVNAIAVAAVLPLGVIWILTRAAGPRKWPLLGWWTLFTMLATLWWSAPLVFVGRYSVPFLDYIENATITTVPTDLARTLLGQSDWVAYFAGIDYPAGQQLVATPFLVLDAAVVAAFGLAGVALRSNPHQRFLTWGVLTGLVLVGFGYSGELAGFLAVDRGSWLDGTLAALRNLHKFDLVLRIPLVLGLAHVMGQLPSLVGGRRDRGSVWAVRLLRAAAVIAVVAMTLPWAQDRIAPREGVVEVPGYWHQVADYLHDNDDGTVSLVVPASAFGVYEWGNVHDDILQGLADSPWAVRNVIPLAQPGDVAFLDAVTRALESGHPSDTLAAVLAENGVGRLVVRNDLDRFQTGAPDPAYVRSVLVRSPGITLAKSFGPDVGAEAHTEVTTAEGDVRIVVGSGISAVTGSVDVYDVEGAAAATLTPNPQALVGDPGSSLQEGMADLGPGPRVIAEDAAGEERGQVLTDGSKRREVNFAAVRANQSATMPAIQPFRLRGPEHQHRFLRHPERWQTTEAWTGDVVSAEASSSQAYSDAEAPLAVGTHPGAALDLDPATAWQSARNLDPTGQWWQESFARPTSLSRVKITMGRGSAAVEQLLLQTDDGTRVVPAPAPGEARTFALGAADATFLRITSAGREVAFPGAFSIAEVEVPEVVAQRVLDLPLPDDRLPVDAVSLTRDQDRAVCAPTGAVTYACDDSLIVPGEDGDTLARRFVPSFQDVYELHGTVSLRRTTDASVLLSSGVQVTSDAAIRDVAESPVALGDGDTGTTWVSRSQDETVLLRLPAPQRVHTLTMTIDPGAPAALPTEVKLTSGDRSRVFPVDDRGTVTLPGWDVTTLALQVKETERAFSTVGQQFVPLPAGISELRVNGSPLNAGASVERSFPCGVGPQVVVAGAIRDTALTASTRDLIRGASVPMRVCGSAQLPLAAESTALLVPPTPVFRADSVTLEARDAPAASVLGGVVVHRDDRGSPTSVEVPARSTATVLTLPQNLNAGWTATLDGTELRVQRVDGWKQGWRLPPGPSGTVTLHYAPATPFVMLLAAGLGTALLVLVVALWPRRHAVRESAPVLQPGRPGLSDVVVVVGAGALLAGWWGLAAVVAAVVVGIVWRRVEWGWLAGLALLVGGLGLSQEQIAERSWALTWSQAWILGAVGLLVAALPALRVRGLAIPSRSRSVRGRLPGRRPRAGRRRWSRSPARR